MKKIAGKIAMFLILVMLANTFTGCFTPWAIEKIKDVKDGQALAAFALLIFPLCLFLDIFVLISWIGGGKRSADAPEVDGEFVLATIAALPETERAAAMEKINSMSEQQFDSAVKVIRAFCALPQNDRVLLAEALRSLPETEQAFLTETANSLTDEERAALTDEFSSIPPEEMTRQMKVLLETPSSDWGYREYAAGRFAAGR